MKNIKAALLILTVSSAFSASAADILAGSGTPNVTSPGSGSGITLTQQNCSFYGDGNVYNLARSRSALPPSTVYAGGGANCPAGSFYSGVFPRYWSRTESSGRRTITISGWNGVSVLCCR